MVGPVLILSLRPILSPSAHSSQWEFSSRPINFHYYENEGFLTTHPLNKMPPMQIQPLKGCRGLSAQHNTQFIQASSSLQIIILNMGIGKHRGTNLTRGWLGNKISYVKDRIIQYLYVTVIIIYKVCTCVQKHSYMLRVCI
jgi:hypothetical protein